MARRTCPTISRAPAMASARSPTDRRSGLSRGKRLRDARDDIGAARRQRSPAAIADILKGETRMHVLRSIRRGLLLAILALAAGLVAISTAQAQSGGYYEVYRLASGDTLN